MINGTTVPTGRDNTYAPDEIVRKSKEELKDTAFNADQNAVLDDITSGGGGGSSSDVILDFGNVTKDFDGNEVNISEVYVFNSTFGWQLYSVVYSQEVYDDLSIASWIRVHPNEESESEFGSYRRVTSIFDISFPSGEEASPPSVACVYIPEAFTTFELVAMNNAEPESYILLPDTSKLVYTIGNQV